jgi:hypothetical protein
VTTPTTPPLAARALRAAATLTDAAADVTLHAEHAALAVTIRDAAAALTRSATAYAALAERVGYTAHAVTPHLVSLAVARSLAYDGRDAVSHADGERIVQRAVALEALTDAAVALADAATAWRNTHARHAVSEHALRAAWLLLQARPTT